MHCSQFFFGQKEQSSSSQFRTAASPFDFVDIPDAPEESDILGSFTDSLVEFQPSQIFQSISHGPKTKLFNSHHKSLVNLHSGETVKRKFSIPLELEKSDFNSLGKLRKSNEDFSKIHTLESPSQQYSEAGVEQQQDTAASGYQHRITKETPKLTPGTRQDIRDFQAEGKNHFYRNKSDGVYTPASLVLPRQNTVGIQLKSVEELPNQYRNIFDFPYFNIVQSRVFEEVFYTDKPLVVCAPTGAGKTVIFELGIIRLLMKMGRNVNNIFKVVYMAPIKALCSERFQDWQTKFGEFGLKCMELTGDTDIQDYFELQNVNIIFTTPEKWDSMTRRWRDNTFVIQSVCLFFIDEIHVLNDNTRGATIEAVVSRMKTIQASVGRSSVGLTLPKLRFIAVSATIPNIEDIAEWLGEIDKTKATFFKMDESLRPVRLRKVVLGFPFDEQKGSDFHFDMSLSYKLSGIINTYSDRKPCLVFCSTRKSTQQAAEILSRDSRGSYVRNSEMKQTLQKYCNLIKDGKLRDLVLKGIGFHHAGMDLQDRKMIEELFSTGQLQVLVATSTLAMGVNLPAHLVILKSTQHYNMGAVEEYSDTQVLQMIGRAGRPQFDTTATAVIMTKIKNKMKYESLLNGTQMIESSLHKHLIEHLNAEIVLHTINDLSIAMEWIRHTFLYIRVMKNPKHYSMPLGLSREQIETRLQDLCMRNLNQLASVNLVTMDGETFDVKPTEPGKLMARYCIAFETMKKFCSVPGAESIENLVKMIAESEEFTEIQLRVNEKKLLNTLNKDKNRTTIRYPIQGKIKTKQMKVNCLIQAQLGSLLVQDFSLQQDTTRIFRAAQRLVRCLVELLWTKPDYTSFFHALQLCKCIKAKLWEDSKHVTKQLDGIGPTLSNALANAGVTSFQKVEETNPRELELIVNRHPPFGNQVRASVASLPKYELTIEQVSQYSNARSEVILYLSIANQDKLLEIQKPTALNHTCVMLVGDQDNTILFRRRIMDSYLLKEHRFTRKLEVHKASSGPDLYFHFISQDWVGLDVQSTYTPFYLGAKTVSNRLPACNQTKRSSEVPRRQVSHVKTETTAEQRGCNHRCANKSVCRHKCCNTGTTVSKRPPPTTSGAGSRSCGKTISNYVCDLKNKLNMLTPSAKKIKMTPLTESKPSLNIERFSYTPRASTLTRIPSESPVIGQVPEESHSNTDWLHLNLYQKCREDLMDEQERINEENELPDIDEHSPTPQPQGNNFYSPDNFGHFSLTPRCPNTGQHTVDRDTFEEVEYNTDNAMTTFQDLAATPPSWHQGNLQETATYIQRPQYQRKLFQSTGADNKARYRFKPRATLCVSDLLDSDDRRLSNSRQYNIENETSYRPLYADPSPSEYPDLNYHQVVQSHIEITPRVCCTDQQNPKVHRFGQVVAWSNSQKTTKTGSSDEDWSGSDHDLITAETCFSVNRKSEESIGNTAMVKKLDPVIVDEIDTKNKETATDHCGHAGVDRSEGFWVPRDCFCQNDKALVNKDDASETFNSIFDGIF